MRSTRAFVPLLVVILLAACGGSAGASGDGGGDGPASEAAGTPQPNETTGGGGAGGNGSSGDLDRLADDLTPPDASETSRTSAGGLIFMTFESGQSPGDLESFFEGAISDAGFEILSRTSAADSYSWTFQDPGDNSFGGVVSAAARGDGSGSVVGIQVGSGE